MKLHFYHFHLPENCIEWGTWLDLYQPGLVSKDDVTTIDQLLAASGTCRQPLRIQCRTATPDKTSSVATGQHVRCNLWDGLVCKGSQVSEPSCYNYEVRLGCLKHSAHCCKFPISFRVILSNHICFDFSKRGTLFLFLVICQFIIY